MGKLAPYYHEIGLCSVSNKLGINLVVLLLYTVQCTHYNFETKK